MTASGTPMKPQGQPVFSGTRTPLHHETLVIGDDNVHQLAEIALAVAKGLALGWVLMRVRCPTNDSGGIAWRDDGGDPAVAAGIVTSGMPCEHGGEERYPADPVALRIRRLTADAVYVYVNYYN